MALAPEEVLGGEPGDANGLNQGQLVIVCWVVVFIKLLKLRDGGQGLGPTLQNNLRP